MMAHAGLHIPAEEARFPGFDGIYADIGDQQSIQESLSTFSSHITNLLGIMRQATGRSLVLVDELGTSTDPEEGAALASAVLRHFQRMGRVPGRHHAPARGGPHRTGTPGMMNASVDLDPTTLAPTYQLTVGLPGPQLRADHRGAAGAAAGDNRGRQRRCVPGGAGYRDAAAGVATGTPDG